MLLSEHTLKVEILEYQSAESAEAGTTTTNVKITGHGLLTGDFMVNATRRATTILGAERGSRKITKVDDDNFTVSPAIAGQTTGDVIWLFAFIDRTDYVKDGSLTLNRKVEHENSASFNVLINL